MMTDRPPRYTSRQKVLNERRLAKMAESAHAYVRGSTSGFYQWLGRPRNAAKIPQGPPIWICGDCHTGNLGPVADVKGNVEIQIRDLDQTVVGNPAVDIIRMGLSLAMAARSSDLPGITTALMIQSAMCAYSKGLRGVLPRPPIEGVPVLQKVFRSALRRRWKHLAAERIEDVKPIIPLGKNFWPLRRDEKEALAQLFADDKAQKLLHQLTGTKSKRVKLVDAAFWVKGCSSLGRRRYAALVKVGNHHRLIDIKEATDPVAPRYRVADAPKNNAERVVAGALALSPFLGERMFATRLLSHDVVVRELRPQDLKFELNAISFQEAVLLAGVFGAVLGKAHGRQLGKSARRSWAAQLHPHRRAHLAVSHWLWQSVVELVAAHESAYLMHCSGVAPAHVKMLSRPLKRGS